MIATNQHKPVLLIAVLLFTVIFFLDVVYAQNVSSNITSQEFQQLVKAGTLRITYVVEKPYRRRRKVCYIKEIYYENMTRIEELEKEVRQLKLTIRRLKRKIEKLNETCAMCNVTPPWVLPAECNVTIRKTVLNITNVTVYEITNLTCPEPIVNVSCPQPNISLECPECPACVCPEMNLTCPTPVVNLTCPEPNITLQCPEIEFPQVFTQECKVTIVNVTEHTYNLTCPEPSINLTCPEPVVECPELETEELIKTILKNVTEQMRMLNLTCPEPVIDLECPVPEINLTCPEPNISLECPSIEFPEVLPEACIIQNITCPQPNISLECPPCPNVTLECPKCPSVECPEVNFTCPACICPEPNVTLECPECPACVCPEMNLTCPECPACVCEYPNITLPLVVPEECEVTIVNKTEVSLTCPQLNITCPEVVCPECPSVDCPPCVCPNVSVVCPQIVNFTLPYVAPEECRIVVQNVTVKNVTVINVTYICNVTKQNITVTWPKFKLPTALLVLPGKIKGGLARIGGLTLRAMSSLSKGLENLLLLPVRVGSVLLSRVISLTKSIGESFVSCVARIPWWVYLLFSTPIVAFFTLLWYQERVRKTPEEFLRPPEKPKVFKLKAYPRCYESYWKLLEFEKRMRLLR